MQRRCGHGPEAGEPAHPGLGLRSYEADQQKPFLTLLLHLKDIPRTGCSEHDASLLVGSCRRHGGI